MMFEEDDIMSFDDDREVRIKAKYDLWAFLHSSYPDFKKFSDKKELAEELSHNIIRILHPHFNFSQIFDEIKTVTGILYLPDVGEAAASQIYDLFIANLKAKK